MVSTQSLSLRWNDYSSYIAGAFESLRYEEDLVDVTLCCEGRKIRAHKMLLSACSNYFKDVFKENPSQHPIIIFNNVKFTDLHLLIEFMYKGEVNVLQESLPSFLQTANILSIRGLSEPFSDQQNLPTIVQDLPRSMLAQKILQTQSQNMNSATITTDEVYYALTTPESTFSPQIKTELQPTMSQQFIGKVVLKPTNELTVPNDLGDSIIPQMQPQQQQNNSITNLPHQSTAASQAPKKRGKQRRWQTNGSKPAMTSMDDQIIAQSSTSKPDESKQSLQELVNCVLPTSRPLRIAHILQQNDATNKEAVTTKTTSPTVPETPTNGSEMYNATTAQSEDISEFINVGESLGTTCGDSSAYTQPADFKIVCENITNQSQSEEPMEQQSGFEMHIVDMGVDNAFMDEDKAVVLHTAMDDTGKTQMKLYKCNSCDKSFVTWKSLAMHRHIHSGRTKCNICGAVLSRTANLKRHMKLKHEP
ncbi:protein bric-a-brac 1-like [Anopheles moucheti]|uniref:protein bric-a-brac 1-like n=1 Tax=Anopheles moucheti TaxID=186751 RepID=UPI0022F100C0|nr:protein bric-a-brac 1-like [Anopheles moucheti]